MTRPATTGWCLKDMPDQSGRTVVITGGTSGIGLVTATAYVGRGAHVVVTSRSEERGKEAVGQLRTAHPAASVESVQLDLASLLSVRECARALRQRHPRIDVLVNNAGVMDAPPGLSVDGYEVTFATNHLGHFALTGQLVPSLLAAPSARVVTVASNAHRRGHLDLEALDRADSSTPGEAYDRSKLANLLFSHELDRRLRASGTRARALAAHPGVVRTELWRSSSAIERALLSRWARPLTFWFAQDPAEGALPVLRASSDPSASGGEYYGPLGRGENVGPPGLVQPSTESRDQQVQQDLWSWSEHASGVEFRLGSSTWPGT